VVVPRPAPALLADADQAWVLWRDAAYVELAALLPPLLAEATVLADAGPDERALSALVRASVVARGMLQHLGWLDLATLVARDALTRARALGDPAHLAAAHYAYGSVLVSSGSRARALAVLQAGTPGDPHGDDERCWWAMSHCRAAFAAGGLGLSGEAATHLAEARDLTRHIQGDPWRAGMTTTEVDIWRVGVALENGEPDRAPEYAARVDVSRVTAQRRASLLMQVGRGHFAAGHPDDAVTALLEADALSPTDLRHSPAEREVVAQMVRDATTRGGSAALRDLAVRCRVDPDM
jgi:hypothetical protein